MFSILDRVHGLTRNGQTLTQVSLTPSPRSSKLSHSITHCSLGAKGWFDHPAQHRSG
jgi:hypothetical protein